MFKRLIFIPSLALLVSEAPVYAESLNAEFKASDIKENTLVVYKNPQCGCCGKWVEHINDFGFSSQIDAISNVGSIKSKYGIEPRYRSCHTAVVDGYAFEGHIPAHVIRQFLTEKPQNVIGLSVPGMPAGSPGMEMGDRHDAYDVLLLKQDGSTEVYAHISGH